MNLTVLINERSRKVVITLSRFTGLTSKQDYGANVIGMGRPIDGANTGSEAREELTSAP